MNMYTDSSCLIPLVSVIHFLCINSSCLIPFISAIYLLGIYIVLRVVQVINSDKVI